VKEEPKHLPHHRTSPATQKALTAAKSKRPQQDDENNNNK
jgi:hypothetical protein